jgi:acetyltransferase-like isoleucine patch superfamily enzyme
MKKILLFINSILGRYWIKINSRMNNYASAYAVKLLRSKLASVGSNVEFFSDLQVHSAESVVIGDWIYIGPGCQFFGRGGINIADHVIIGPQVIIMTSMHNYKNSRMIPYDEIELLSSVTIGEACWIGFNAMLMPGVKLGKGCIVGAGSVVTKSFPDGSILAGNPAKIISQRDMEIFNNKLDLDMTYLKNWYFKKLEKKEKRVQ